MLWLQERVDFGEIRFEKWEGEDNTADIGTKAVTAPVLRKHLKTLKMEWGDGRHPLTFECCIVTLIFNFRYNALSGGREFGLRIW